MFAFGPYAVTVVSKDGAPEVIGEKKREACLNHDSDYAFLIENNHQTLGVCVEVEIDGKQMGDFIIRPRRHLLLERPSHEDRKFHFLAVSSDSAKNCGAIVGKSSNGEVQFKFLPELKKRTRERSRSRDRDCSAAPPRPVFSLGSAASVTANPYIDGCAGASGGGGARFGSVFRGLSFGDRSEAAAQPPPYSVTAAAAAAAPMATTATEAGVTVFGDKSQQTFTTASFQEDANCYVMLTFKLVARVKLPLAPLTGVNEMPIV